MPQLDLLAYSSEVIWLITIFFILYFLVLRLGLPKIYKVLRYRQDKLLLISNSVEKLEKEIFFLNRNVRELVLQSLGYLKSLHDSLVKLTDSEIENAVAGSKNNILILREYRRLNANNLINKYLLSKKKSDELFVKKELLNKLV